MVGAGGISQTLAALGDGSQMVGCAIDHGVIRMVCVGTDLNDHLVPTPLLWAELPLYQIRLPRAPSSLALGTSRDGAPTASLSKMSVSKEQNCTKKIFSNENIHTAVFLC